MDPNVTIPLNPDVDLQSTELIEFRCRACAIDDLRGPRYLSLTAAQAEVERHTVCLTASTLFAIALPLAAVRAATRARGPLVVGAPTRDMDVHVVWRDQAAIEGLRGYSETRWLRVNDRTVWVGGYVVPADFKGPDGE